MKKQNVALYGLVTLIAVLAFATLAIAAEQTKCPTCGHAVDGTKHVDADGKRIYVCGDNCAKEVTADPKKFIAKLEGAGVTVAKVQTACPTCGMKVDGSLHVDADGKRIYVCNDGCGKKVSANPKKYIAQLEKEGVTLDLAAKAQESCPVMGGKINKSLYVDTGGKRIYVCCGGCIDTVKADPDKYIGILKERGESVESLGN